MNKTKQEATIVADKRAVDATGLQAMLGVGKKTAVEIGTAAGARCQIGRRVLYNVSKVQAYLDEISE